MAARNYRFDAKSALAGRRSILKAAGAITSSLTLFGAATRAGVFVS